MLCSSPEFLFIFFGKTNIDTYIYVHTFTSCRQDYQSACQVLHASFAHFFISPFPHFSFPHFPFLVSGQPVWLWVVLLTVTTSCDFERGGATKPIIGSSWSNGIKNRLDLHQVQKRPSMIMLIVFRRLDVCKRLCDPAWSNFFADSTHTPTHTDTDMKALLYPCCACAHGVKVG